MASYCMQLADRFKFWWFKRGNDQAGGARVNRVNGLAVVGRSLHSRGFSMCELDSLYIKEIAEGDLKT